jgi:hypothetical protein
VFAATASAAPTLPAASTSLMPLTLEPVATLTAARSTPSSSWADAWLVSGRVVPAGGVISARLALETSLTSRDPGSSTAPRTPAPTGDTARASGSASVTPVTGGRSPASARGPGLGFTSPLGRFAITDSGLLLGGSDDGTASVRLVVPGALVGLAALVGVLALIGQARAEHRRRLVE